MAVVARGKERERERERNVSDIAIAPLSLSLLLVDTLGRKTEAHALRGEVS